MQFGKDKIIGGGKRYAIWLYAKKRDDRCSFIVRRMQEEYRGKDKKLCMCFVVKKRPLIEFQEE